MIKVNKNNQLGNKNKINNSFVSDTLDNSSDFEQQVCLCVFCVLCSSVRLLRKRKREYEGTGFMTGLVSSAVDCSLSGMMR